ncbi:hypothetical protein [Porphyrobacter sp. YT40]|uniref:hypothetical protein n=1 Tax=Porphyrobacter sp. YT40 TaxID=2547601 RepID=UPI00114396A5|nr:hypothetical protein [Porphyrobacter sp. YT40]QDH34640.1 hypothetical protein E2E27_10085 [Porphyrobacter sp. YT40]
MSRTLQHLGRTPLTRRIVAAAILFGAAAGVTWLRAESDQVWIELGLNLFAAWAAFGFLHFRWRKREAHELTPAKAEDIFS